MTFGDNLSVLYSRVKQSKKKYFWHVSPFNMGPIGCLEISVINYQSTLCKIPAERRHQLVSSPGCFRATNWLLHVPQCPSSLCGSAAVAMLGDAVLCCITSTHLSPLVRSTYVFGPKRDEVPHEWEKLHNEKLNDL